MIQKRTVWLSIVAVLLFVGIASYFSGVHTVLVKAASIVFSPPNCFMAIGGVKATATSTLNYMTPGTATSTVTCELGTDGSKSAVLVVEVNATSTNTTYVLGVEESMDSQDWFPVTLGQIASTTNPFNLSVVAPGRFQYQFASSTIGGVAVTTGTLGVAGTNNRNHFSLDIPVRMDRVRVWASLATTTGDAGDNGAVWMKIIPKSG